LYWGYSPGGVAKYAVLLDASKRYASVDIQHVCIRGRKWPTDAQTLRLLNVDTIWIRSRADLSWIKELKTLIGERAPDIIITHGFNGHFIVQLMRVLGYYKGSAVCSYHGEYHPMSRSRNYLAPFFNRFTEWYVRRVLSVVAVAEFSKRYLVTRGAESRRIKVVHNGIKDVEVAADAGLRLKHDWGIGVGKRVIGVASRLESIKGIAYLISAFANLAKRHLNIVLVIVGVGAEETALREQVNQLGLGKQVRFLGFRSDVAECLTAFDIFVLPSLAEAHSIGLLEAMRAGKAIVATAVGGNTESVRNEQEGLIVPAADAEALEAALDKLLFDKALREQLAVNARERFLAEFTENTMLKKAGAWLSHCAELAAQQQNT
jgi:glycosyltransferase involved in cell wall biosynthesis